MASDYTFEWEKFEVIETPKATLNSGSIKLNKEAVALLKGVEKVSLGFDAKKNAIGIASAREGHPQYPFSKANKDGSITIMCRKFMTGIADRIGSKLNDSTYDVVLSRKRLVIELDVTANSAELAQ